MYDRALQGYEDALGLELASSYLPALNTLFAFGDLFLQTDRKDMAKAMYNRALPRYTNVQGRSSNQYQTSPLTSGSESSTASPSSACRVSRDSAKAGANTELN
ncbi:hypothetical protein B0O99DRAFT_591724 [Bisporella sp. PMI_857]|nr:hypothetical protein B0O99DRAFT_591724 [Bisporella sp. PMI_857]